MTAMPMHGALDRARRLLAQGDLGAADPLLDAVCAEADAPAAVVALAARVKLGLGRLRDSRDLALRAAQRAPSEPAAILDVVRLLRMLEEPQALQDLAGRIAWDRLDTPLPDQAEAAILLSSAALYAPAQACVDRMLALAPDYPDAHYLDGLLAMFVGEEERSLAALERALRLEPRMANAHWLVAMQGRADTAQQHIRQMAAALQGIVPGSEAQGYLFYALHHRLHALRRYPEAWDALRRGHAVIGRRRRYDSGEQHRLFEALKSLLLPRYAPPTAAADQPGLIFIVGMFRSGTTLLERLLAGHPDIADGGETYQFSAAMRYATGHYSPDVIDPVIVERAAAADFDGVRERMHAYARWRAGGRRWLTEKLPSNFMNLGLILHALPEARVIHLRRDPADTCFSNLRTLFQGNAPYACSQEHVAEYFLQYRSLMDHWHAQAPGRILDVDYAALVSDPESSARRIFEYCGVDYHAGALELGRSGGHAATASAAHVRKGILTDRSAAWHPYAADLRPLLSRLGEPAPG